MPITFATLAQRHRLQPIRGCPGRWIVRDVSQGVGLGEWLGDQVAVEVSRSSEARDPVHVARLPDGGIISYARADGTYLHTLNDRDGFARKLQQLGIATAERDASEQGERNNADLALDEHKTAR
jgi:hypothetical protein